MKRYLYCLALIMSAILVQVSAQTSGPSYDQKTPPAFEWGTGKRNPQTQGTPTKDDHTIINNISVTVDNVEENLKSKTSDKSVTEVSEDILTKITDNHSELSDTLATITSDVEDVGDRLKSRTSDKNVTEVTEEILAAVGSNSADINGIAGLLKGEDASGTHSIYDKICKIDEVYTLLDESLITKINTIADYLNGTSDSTQAALIKAIYDELASNTGELTNIGNHLYYTPEDSEEAIDIARLANDILVAVYTQDGEEKKSIADLVRDIPQTDLTNTNNLISSNTEKIDSLLTAVNYSNGSDTFSVADIVYDISESVKNLDFSGSMSIDISETNSLIASNTEKQCATVTHTVPYYVDDTLNTSSVKSIAEMIAEQLGSTVNTTTYEVNDEGEPYEAYTMPNVCRLVNDIGEIINNVIYTNLDWYLCYPTYTDDGELFGSEPSLVTNRRELLEDGSDKSTPVGIASTLMSAEPIEVTASYSRTMTVADGLFTDKDGNPAHVLGRILNAVENGSSTSSSGSADLSKLERAVGVVLNEGSDGDKGEPPEVDIKLVDMFYDKGAEGASLEEFFFRGDDSAYLNEGVSMYDMVKLGLFGLDNNGNVVPLVEEMQRVSRSKDNTHQKAADLVYDLKESLEPFTKDYASMSRNILLIESNARNIHSNTASATSKLNSIFTELQNIKEAISAPTTTDLTTTNNKIGSNTEKLGEIAELIEAIPTTDLTATNNKIGSNTEKLGEIAELIEAIPVTDLTATNNKIGSNTEKLGEIAELIEAIPVTDLTATNNKIGSNTEKLGEIAELIEAIQVTDLTTTNNKIGSNTEKLGEIAELIEAIQVTDLTTTNNKIGSNTEKLGEIAELIEAIPTTDLTATNNKIGSNTEKLGEIAELIEAIPVTDLTTTNNKIGSNTEKLGEIAELIEAIPVTDLTTTNNKIGSNTEKLGEIAELIEAIQVTDLTTTNNKIGSNTEKLGEIAELIEAIPVTDLTATNNKIGSNTEKLGEIEELITEIKQLASETKILMGTISANNNELVTMPSKGMRTMTEVAIGMTAKEIGDSESDIPSQVPSGYSRQFIEILGAADDSVFFVAFEQSGGFRKVTGRILINVTGEQHIWIKAGSAATVSITEGWR